MYTSFHERYAMYPNGSIPVPRNSYKCCGYIASKNKYCARMTLIQKFCDIYQDVIGEAHLSGYSFSVHNNIIHPSAELGSKTTVRPQCMQMGDKYSVKLPVIGPHCHKGSNVKVTQDFHNTEQMLARRTRKYESSTWMTIIAFLQNLLQNHPCRKKWQILSRREN